MATDEGRVERTIPDSFFSPGVGTVSNLNPRGFSSRPQFYCRAIHEIQWVSAGPFGLSTLDEYNGGLSLLLGGSMLQFTGDGSVRTCDGITRRDFLQVGVLGAIGLGLPQLNALEALGAVDGDHDDRSVIMIFNLGAPSQLDTWDMKPDAPREIRGPFMPIRTNNPDIQISEIFPMHAKLADKFSLVRTCYHTAAAVHDTGHQMMQTGRLFTGGVNTPHSGCALEYLKGRKNELPANVILPEVMGPTGGNLPHGQDAGFLGKSFDPFVLNADPSKKDFKVPDLLPPSEIGEVRLQRRRELRDVVEGTAKNFEASANAQLMDASFESAYRLM